MEIASALAFLDGCRHWSLTKGAASCRPSGLAERPLRVRRRKGEALAGMICRLALLACGPPQGRQGRAQAYLGAAAACAGCQAPNGQGRHRLERRLGLVLCPDCRAGLQAPSKNVTR